MPDRFQIQVKFTAKKLVELGTSPRYHRRKMKKTVESETLIVVASKTCVSFTRYL